jgi:hypothetical protein
MIGLGVPSTDGWEEGGSLAFSDLLLDWPETPSFRGIWRGGTPCIEFESSDVEALGCEEEPLPPADSGVGPPTDAVGASAFVVLGPSIVVPTAFGA